MAYGKAIELFLVDGLVDSLIIAELSNWSGKAFKIPRIKVQSCKRDDLNVAGVYFLFCKEDDGSDSVYIGESENVKDRLVQHIRDFNADKEKFEWNTAVIFTGRDLDKTSIRYLENRLVEITKKASRYKVLTKNTYANTVIKESQIAAMEEFKDDIKILLNALGYKVLEPLVDPSIVNDTSNDDLLYFSGNDFNATAIETSDGFVVIKGSKIREKETNSIHPWSKNQRIELKESGKIGTDYVLQEDVLFSSSSGAASFVVGSSASGPRSWKNKDGKLLKDLQAVADN